MGQAGFERAVMQFEPVAIGPLSDHLPESYVHRQETEPHESPPTMTIPLMVLALLAAVGGFINLPFTSDLHYLGHWLEPSLFGNEVKSDLSGAAKWALGIVAVIGGAVGIAAAVMVYLRGRVPTSRIELPILARAWRFDEGVTAFMGGPGRKGFDLVAWFDATIIDGAVNGVGRIVREGGGQLRRVQSGFVRSYAAMVAIGAIGLMVWFLVRASF